MARLQMGRFCMICLDYIRTYLEYLGNWSPLIFIHTLPRTLSLSAITSPRASRAVLFWGDSLFKVIPEHPLDIWKKSHNPWSTNMQLSAYSSLLLFALTESSLPPIQVLDVYEIPKFQPRSTCQDHLGFLSLSLEGQMRTIPHPILPPHQYVHHGPNLNLIRRMKQTVLEWVSACSEWVIAMGEHLILFLAFGITCKTKIEPHFNLLLYFCW